MKNENPTPEKKGGKLKILIALLVIVVIAGGAVLLAGGDFFKGFLKLSRTIEVEKPVTVKDVTIKEPEEPAIECNSWYDEYCNTFYGTAPDYCSNYWRTCDLNGNCWDSNEDTWYDSDYDTAYWWDCDSYGNCWDSDGHTWYDKYYNTYYWWSCDSYGNCQDSDGYTWYDPYYDTSQ